MAEPTGNQKPETPIRSIAKGAAFPGAGIDIGVMAAAGKISPMGVGAAGVGIGAIISQIISGQPQVLSTLLNWGPGLVIIFGLGYFGNQFIPRFLELQRAGTESQSMMAMNLGELAGAIKDSLNKDDDVRDAVRTLAAKMDRQYETILNHIASSKQQESAQ